MTAWKKISAWTKGLTVAVLAVAALYVLLIAGMTVFVRNGAQHHVDRPAAKQDCELDRTRLFEGLKSAADRDDPACFVQILRHSGLSSHPAQALEISAYLAKQLSAQEDVPLVFQDHYVRLEALNFVVPDALAGDISFDTTRAHAYVREQTDSDNTAIRNRALVVLSYYRSDDDVRVFRKHAVAQSDEEVFYSVRALAEHCSPKAKEALKWALSQERVERYLQKYHGKETLTSLIAQRCPLDSSEERSKGVGVKR